MKTHGLIINGKELYTDENITVINKYTLKEIGYIGSAEKHHISEAVDTAYKRFSEEEIPPYQRYEILLKSSNILKQRREEVAKVLVEEVGKTLNEAKVEVDRAIQTLILSAEEAKRISGEIIPINASPGSEDKFGFYMRVPIGVICAITPFNVPLNLACHKIGPAIAAGNTVVWKPASNTPLNAFILMDILKEAGLPDGHVNLVTGSGSKLGRWLLEDKRIDKYTFTGSPKIGENIKALSGLRNVSLELGNNSPNIICNDANLEMAAKACVKWGLANAGQACISAQRLYVDKNVIEDFTNLLLEELKGIKLGDPMDSETDIGPLISESEAERVEKWINDAVVNGAKLLFGGERNGSIITPTLLSDVNQDMKIVCEEIFGPVMTISPFDDFDEAIKLSNDSDYGLQSGIFTSSNKKALYAMKKLRTGGVVINDGSTFRADLMPYGGIKNSGIGREGPKYAVEEMTEIKTIIMNLDDGL